MRIVSLVPSLTDMVCAFGLREALVGCTQFCVKPTGLHKSAALVGGTKDPDLEQIHALNPTHILVNEEENKPEHISACQQLAPTFVCFPKDPRAVPAMLRDAGFFLGVAAAGEREAQTIEMELARLAAVKNEREAAGAWRGQRYLYFIWREPYMVASHDTYISAMLGLVGYENVAPEMPRYPAVTVDEARTLGAEVIFLSSEPYPFRQRDAVRLSQEWRDEPKILKADGQLFSWYGTALGEALRAMANWLKAEPQHLVLDF